MLTTLDHTPNVTNRKLDSNLIFLALLVPITELYDMIRGVVSHLWLETYRNLTKVNTAGFTQEELDCVGEITVLLTISLCAKSSECPWCQIICTAPDSP